MTIHWLRLGEYLVLALVAIGPLAEVRPRPARWSKRRRIPGGEDQREAQRRIITFADDVVRRHPGQDVVVVGHGEILGAALPRLPGLCDPPVMATGSVTAVRCAGPGFLSCESWGPIEHLADDLVM